MSEKLLPILFLNLSGEMVYVLLQRLDAQNIDLEKAKKIMHEIIANMMNGQLIDEIFRPQEILSLDALKTLFNKLAHTSIMRLNETSMEKLFDLMIMNIKYQLCLCPKPKDILLVTLNHLDSIRNCVHDSPSATSLVKNVYSMFESTYYQLSEGEFQLIRHFLLNHLQDLKIKVQPFLDKKLQNFDGSFILVNESRVPKGTPIPGTICFYEENSDKNVSRITNFNTNAIYEISPLQGSLDEIGDRRTSLGKSIYDYKQGGNEGDKTNEQHKVNSLCKLIENNMVIKNVPSSNETVKTTETLNGSTPNQQQPKEQVTENALKLYKHVMISYASQTRDNVIMIKNALEKCGFTIWIDVQDMRNKIFKDMATGIEDSSHVIVCISEYYEMSDYCEKELSYAISIKKPLIPIIVQEGYKPKGWVGVAVSDTKYYSITNQTELTKFLPEVIERIDKKKFEEIVSTICTIS